MKLRIKGDSLRLRLSQGEMRSLAERGEVQDRVRFPGGSMLIYRVRADRMATDISVTYDNNLIDVLVPHELCARWYGTDLVTLSANQALSAGALRIVLEKDWACLAPREGEDESDNFPHPRSDD